MDFCFQKSGGTCSCHSLLFDLDEHAIPQSLCNCAPDGRCSAEKEPQLCCCRCWGSGGKGSGSALCSLGSIFCVFAILLLYCISKTQPGSQGEINSSPLGACQTTSGVLCPFWGLPSMRKKPVQTRASPEESSQDGLGAGTHERGGKLGFCSLKRKRLVGRRGNCHL